MKQPIKLTKKNLERFCINEPCMRYNPCIANLLAGRFGLDIKKIRFGWIEKETKFDRQGR